MCVAETFAARGPQPSHLRATVQTVETARLELAGAIKLTWQPAAHPTKAHWHVLQGSSAHLMVAAYEVHGGGVLDLEGQQQADGFQAVGPPVHVVPQEQVVDVWNIPCSAGRPVLLKQAHEVPELAVQVAEDLHGGCDRAGGHGGGVWTGCMLRLQGWQGVGLRQEADLERQPPSMAASMKLDCAGCQASGPSMLQNAPDDRCSSMQPQLCHSSAAQ